MVGHILLVLLFSSFLSGKEKADMVHSISGWTQGVQVKLWDPLRTRAIPEHLGDVFTMRHYANPRLPLPSSWLQTVISLNFALKLCFVIANNLCIYFWQICNNCTVFKFLQFKGFEVAVLFR